MRRGVVGLTLFAVPVLAVLLALGFWQLARKSEKEALIATVEARAFGAAVDVPPRADWPRLDLDAVDYQKVRLTGRFRNGPEFDVYTIVPDPRGGTGRPGWLLYLPFDLAQGGTVLVNRGAVPEPLKARERRPPTSAPPQGEVTIEGLVLRPQARGLFTPADDPGRNIWHTRDPAAFARAGALGEVAPFTVEQSTPNPGGLPLAGMTRVSFPNRHLEYALTWFGLAATLIAVWGVYVRRQFLPR